MINLLPDKDKKQILRARKITAFSKFLLVIVLSAVLLGLLYFLDTEGIYNVSP